jgi:GNAT superfamily N-acetyltransferase
MITCRTAIPSEREALEALQWRASLNNPGDRAALLSNPDAIELPDSQIAGGDVFVAERNGLILGFAAVLPCAGGEMELDALFVEPHLWGQGIGRSLVEHCAQVARSRGASALHVIGNPHAEGFYRACRFDHIGTAQTRFGVGLSFRRSL